MPRSIVLAVVVCLFASTCHADDAIAPEVVRAVKQATVYIRVESADGNKSGSGFVVAVNGETAFVTTNHHVVGKRPIADGAPTPPSIKVVFDSGTKTERSLSGEIVASDVEHDLAVLKVTGVKDPPKPVSYADPPAPVETMAVYSFGFPFGDELASGKGSPAITVGKASVSSLRNGDDGELATIQIDGNLNPGNSGGPVVDGKGRLVGVAVAILKEGQGIGFLVPAAEVVRTMDGRIGRVRVAARQETDGKPAVRIEADLIDPMARLRGVTAHYVLVPPKAKKPDSTALDKYPGSRKLALKVEKSVAVADLAVEKVEGEVFVQVIGERASGDKFVATRVRGFTLFAGLKPGDLAGPPPEGWTNYLPEDKSFAIWLPTKPVQQQEKQRDVRTAGEVMRIRSVVGKTVDGLVYSAEYVVLPPTLAGNTPVQLHAMVRGVLLDEGRGRFTESVEAVSGSLQGVQYQIQYADDVARSRVFISRGGVVRVVRVHGTAEQVASVEAETILQSFRLPGDDFARKTPVPPLTGGIPRPTTLGHENDPKIVAGGRAPLFKDMAPNGGLLIGLEIGLGKFGREDVIKSVRPIYRASGKEVFGVQRGTTPAAATIKAKEGYAVGAMTCKSGLNFDGCSLSFMRIKDGKLDHSDAYESEWVGYSGNKQPTRIGGDGIPVVGIVGRGSEREVNGLGLLFKGQEDFNPEPPPHEPIIIAGGGASPFKDLTPKGGLLIGLEIGLGKFFDEDVIKAVRPIYRVNSKEEFGVQHGPRVATPITIKAKDGYAVGAMKCKSGANFDGCSLIFMKVKGGKLDASDSYESEWVGYNGPKDPVRIGGGGISVVGIVGRGSDREVNGLGLLFKGQVGADAESTAVDPQVPSYLNGKQPFIFGSIRDPMFKSVGPARGVLIGLEAKFTKFGSHDIVRAVRPIYRVADKEETGQLTGADLTGAVKLTAKEGYAVGGMSAKADWWCHGFSLTYMKVKRDGTLDPKDTYESEWVGWNGQMDVRRITGNGTVAVGLVGKIVRGDTTALGLLFKGQEAFDPNAPLKEDQQVQLVPIGKDPFILGSIRDPQFKTVGPEGAVLIGLEAKFTKFGAHDIVRAIRPIYRVGGKEEFGKQFGGDLTGAVTLKAKDGYAVGVISGKAKLWCHGFSLTYMKVKPDGTLDPKDSYESDWVGWNGEMAVTKVSGDGTPVVGIVGKIVGDETTALGLLFKGQEEFDPARR